MSMSSDVFPRSMSRTAPPAKYAIKPRDFNSRTISTAERNCELRLLIRSPLSLVAGKLQAFLASLREI